LSRGQHSTIELDNRHFRPDELTRRTRGENGTSTGRPVVRDLNPLAVLRPLLPIIHPLQPIEINAPDGNRTHIPQITLGVLSRLNYGTSHKAAQPVRRLEGAVLRGGGTNAPPGKFRWASGVIERRHSMPGIEPGPPRLSPRTVHPPCLWKINDQLRPIEIGVTNRIRTGTNAFTGRDASCYIMITIKRPAKP
jgi:hypothetical protein